MIQWWQNPGVKSGEKLRKKIKEKQISQKQK
jgi:hypothetical protein